MLVPLLTQAVGLVDGLAFGRQTLNGLADEFLQASFALEEEVSTHPIELVRPLCSTGQRILLHVLLVDEAHATFSPALYLS